MTLTTLNKLMTVIFLLAFVHTTYGQTIDNYKLSLSGIYLPGGGGRSEIYSKSNGKLDHKASEIQHGRRPNKWKQKRRTIKNDLQIEATINKLDSLFRSTEFKFAINRSIIDSIKARNDRNEFYKIPSAEIEQFFSKGDTVMLNLKDIKQAEFEGFVIDGYPYTFDLIIMRPNQDSITYKFHGNFYDGVETSNIKNWLPVYLTYREKRFLETMPMGKYFTDENLKDVLIRFIRWTSVTKHN